MDLYPFVSIQIPSNRPKQVKHFLNQLELTADDCNTFEVIFNLDCDDVEVSSFLEAQKKIRPFSIKYIKTFSGGFYNSWRPINEILPFTHKNAYFLIFLSDEFLFKTKGWDSILKTYIHYYPDNIFRLRASQFRFRNYTDFWECGFAPDSICFTTKKWVEIIKDWGPCFSSDAFQQFIAFYLQTSDSFTREQFNRDLPIPHIEFSGEGASIGLTGQAAIERARGGLHAWFKLVSYDMQTEACRRAMLLKANIIKDSKKYKGLEIVIQDNPDAKQILLINRATDETLDFLTYKLNRYKINFINTIRKLNYLYYAGGGKGATHGLRNVRYNLTYYLAFRYKALKNLHDRCNLIEGKLLKRLSKFKLIFKTYKP